MTNIAIYGAGGFGRETALMIDQMNRFEKSWNVKGFYDDGIKAGEMIDGLPVLGGIKEVNDVHEPLSIVVAIAEPSVRRKVVLSIRNPKLNFPVMAHPQAMLGGVTNFFGRGTIITAGCILTTGIVIGEFAIVNLTSTLGHDVKLGSFCTIMPGCNISGNVEIDEGTLVGTGAKVLQNLTVGKNCKVGAGAVVTKSFGDNLTVIGVPAQEK